jgi:hypothetical protein
MLRKKCQSFLPGEQELVLLPDLGRLGSSQQNLRRYAPLWSSVALVIHDRERAGNVFVGEAPRVAALLRCVQHDCAALGLLCRCRLLFKSPY